MKRKRFIKLLMSNKGYERNRANGIANLCADYEIAFNRMVSWGDIKDNRDSIGSYVFKVLNSIEDIQPKEKKKGYFVTLDCDICDIRNAIKGAIIYEGTLCNKEIKTWT